MGTPVARPDDRGLKKKSSQSHSLNSKDFRSGIRSGVNGTPTFFINGVRHDAPWDLPTLLAAVEAAAVAAPGAERR
jgi:protein-disulfide isomerase